MHYSRNHLLIILSFVVLFFFSFSVSYADLVYISKASTSGIMGMGKMDMETTTMLKGDKQRQDTKTKFVGAMVQYMPGGGEQNQITITRLDKELIWNINITDKTYTEMTFDQVKKMMERMKSQIRKKPEEEEAKFQFDVKKTGQKKKIGGYECEEHFIKMIAEGRDPQTGKVQEFEVQTHLWVSSKVKGYDQLQDYQKKMAQKMGWEGGQYANFAQGLGQFGLDTEGLAKKMNEIKGFPMLTVVKMKSFGEEMAEAEEERAEQEKAMREAMELLGKKVEKEEKPKEKGLIFEMATEVTEVQVKGVADSEFELPQGMKKQDMLLPTR
ncbi:MAG: hypothetical protein WBD28_08805 [Candidatus Zixiibacteriota bacterium]